MKYKNERNGNIPCINNNCKFWINDVEIQNCASEFYDGEPAVSWCEFYEPKNFY